MKLNEIKRAYRQLHYFRIRAEQYSATVNGQWDRALSSIFGLEAGTLLESIDVEYLYDKAFKSYDYYDTYYDKFPVPDDWLMIHSKDYADRFQT